MNKTELIAVAAEKSSLSKSELERVLKNLIDIIMIELSKGKKIQLMGFGTFETKTRVERKGRNPQNGAEIILPSMRSLVFTPGKMLKDIVNQRNLIQDFKLEGKINEEEEKILQYVFEQSKKSKEKFVDIDIKDISDNLGLDYNKIETIANKLISKKILDTFVMYGPTDSVFVPKRWRRYL